MDRGNPEEHGLEGLRTGGTQRNRDYMRFTRGTQMIRRLGLGIITGGTHEHRKMGVRTGETQRNSRVGLRVRTRGSQRNMENGG